MKKKTKVAKFDAVQIKNGALEQDGKFVAAQIKAMRGYEAAAEEKAGVEMKKALDHRTTVEKRLADVYAKCKGDGIKAFRAMYAPDFGRTKLYEILAIGSGKTTREEIRTKERDKKRAQRSEKSSGQANVPDTSPEPEPEASVTNDLRATQANADDRGVPTLMVHEGGVTEMVEPRTEPKAGNDADPEVSKAERCAVYAELDKPTVDVDAEAAEHQAAANPEAYAALVTILTPKVVTADPAVTMEKSKEVLAAIQYLTDLAEAKMTSADRKAYIVYATRVRRVVKAA